MKQKAGVATEMELDAVRLRIVIEAEFEFSPKDGTAVSEGTIGECIESALDELRGQGTARIVSQKLFGKAKGA